MPLWNAYNNSWPKWQHGSVLRMGWDKWIWQCFDKHETHPCEIVLLFRPAWCRPVILNLTTSRDPWGFYETTDYPSLPPEILRDYNPEFCILRSTSSNSEADDPRVPLRNTGVWCRMSRIPQRKVSFQDGPRALTLWLLPWVYLYMFRSDVSQFWCLSACCVQGLALHRCWKPCFCR